MAEIRHDFRVDVTGWVLLLVSWPSRVAVSAQIHSSAIRPPVTQTAQALADGQREFARQLFADLPAEVLDGFNAGLDKILDRLHTLLAAKET
jgi:hypothetical protein